MSFQYGMVASLQILYRCGFHILVVGLVYTHMIELLLPYYSRAPFCFHNPGHIETGGGICDHVGEGHHTEALPRQRAIVRRDGQYNVPIGLDPALETFIRHLTEATN